MDILEQELVKSLQTIKAKDVTLDEKIFSAFMLLHVVAEEATLYENLNFKTLFARLAYIGSKYDIDKTTLYFVHKFRTINERQLSIDNSKILLELGLTAIHNLIHHIWFESKNIQPFSSEVKECYGRKDNEIIKKVGLIEALVINIDYKEKKLVFLDDAEGDIEQYALYDIEEINEPFTPTINAIEKIYALPVHVNLIDCEIDENSHIIPRAFIINPDYLIDVTSVSSTAAEKETSAWQYATNKLLPKSPSKHILIGNIANYFLDALSADPNRNLKDLYIELFKLNPLEWALYTDEDIKDIMGEVRIHFDNLQRVITTDFQDKGILIGNIYIEPSFYCREYGLQGRLDLYHTNTEGLKADIIELKSGKPFKANTYGINESHYLQTLLYDLIIRSAYEGKVEPQNYILYSKLPSHNLK